MCKRTLPCAGLANPSLGHPSRGKCGRETPFPGHARNLCPFLKMEGMRSRGNEDTRRNGMSRFLFSQRGFPFLPRLSGTLGTLGFRNPSVFSFRLAPETPQTAVGQSWSPDGSKLINRGSCLNLSRLHGSRKGGEREKILICSAGKTGQGGRKSAMPSWIIFVNHGNLFLSKLLKIRFVAVYAR